MRTFGGDYARSESTTYHAHPQCSVGATIRADADLRGNAAKQGRTLCPECARLDGPSTPPRPTFGGKSY
jgi:hypothetical protein